MSSGTFETLFFQKAVPLINDVTGYSTLTMLAVGSNGYLEGYSFHEYQSTCGFQDSSTLTTVLTKTFNSTLTSTITSINSSIDFIGKTYISTIPLVQWVSSQTITNYPYYYNSTFFSSLVSSFVSTGVLAPSYIFDFASTGTLQYGSSITTPSIWLGSNLSGLINSGKYTTYVNLQYSLSLSTNTTFSWISTLGVFNQLDDPSYMYGNKGVSFTTRLGNYQYSHINTTLLFNPQTPGYNTQIPTNVSNFHIELYVNSNTPSASPVFDIFMQGNNITFTLVPLATV